MRQLLSIFTLATSLATVSHAAGDEHFQGTAQINPNLSATCLGSGYFGLNDDRFFQVLLRPSHLNTEGNSYLTFKTLDGDLLMAMTVSGGAIATGATYTGAAVSRRGTTAAWTGSFPLMSPTVATVSATTKILTFTGRISNFLGITGCTVTFKATTVLQDT